MVYLGQTPECSSGNHSACTGGRSVPPGNFGGMICTCGCHKDTPCEECGGYNFFWEPKCTCDPFGLKKKLIKRSE